MGVSLTRPGGTTVMCGCVAGELIPNSAASIIPASVDLCEGVRVRVCVCVDVCIVAAVNTI